MTKVVYLKSREKPPAGKPYILVVGLRGRRGEEVSTGPQGATFRVPAIDLDDTINDMLGKWKGLETLYVRRPKPSAKPEKGKSTATMQREVAELLRRAGSGHLIPDRKKPSDT
jgi:hypothetical protein